MERRHLRLPLIAAQCGKVKTRRTFVRRVFVSDRFEVCPKRFLHRLAKSLLPAVTLGASLIACDGDNSNDKPYFAFAGGGFVFNYRLASADYGFVARVLRSTPPGSIIEAEFENPDGGAPIVLRQSAKAGRSSYVFQTPPLHGVRANHDYLVVLRVLDSEQKELASYRKSFRSSADQSVLPEAAPVIGPGYQRAPPAQ